MVEPVIARPITPGAPTSATHAPQPAASWPAIFAGAVAATALSLVLLALGTGLGFASVSPWSNAGMSSTVVAVSAAIWLIVTQWLSAAVGGYLAGRLQARSTGIHTHEVFFRDTAHGLITWAMATLLVAATLAISAGKTLGAVGHVGGEAAAVAAKTAATSASAPRADYGIDRLFRGAESSSAPTVPVAGTDPKAEVAHIVSESLAVGTVSDDDRTYLAQLIAARTGVPAEDARKRVDEFVTSTMNAEAKAKAAADRARKDTAQAAIYIALSMLVGAFVASIAAALGGHLRDEQP